jgi:hypothetical protein
MVKCRRRNFCGHFMNGGFTRLPVQSLSALVTTKRISLAVWGMRAASRGQDPGIGDRRCVGILGILRPQCCPGFWRSDGGVLRIWKPPEARQMDDLKSIRVICAVAGAAAAEASRTVSTTLNLGSLPFWRIIPRPSEVYKDNRHQVLFSRVQPV